VAELQRISDSSVVETEFCLKLQDRGMALYLNENADINRQATKAIDILLEWLVPLARKPPTL
jgi:hypothetical protein